MSLTSEFQPRMNLVGFGLGCLAGHQLELATLCAPQQGACTGCCFKKKKKEGEKGKTGFLFLTGSAAYGCSLLEEALQCSSTCKSSSKRGVMLGNRALRV